MASPQIRETRNRAVDATGPDGFRAPPIETSAARGIGTETPRVARSNGAAPGTSSVVLRRWCHFVVAPAERVPHQEFVISGR